MVKCESGGRCVLAAAETVVRGLVVTRTHSVDALQ